MPRRHPAPDAAARDAIVTRLDVSMLVEAGAGSGKTTSMARRMVAMIASGKCSVNQMAAITFTRKAAAELRGRFQVELEESLRTETDQAIVDRLSEALAHLEQLFAGTVHAFCGRLLRERPVEAHVATAFEEIDDDQDAIIRHQAWHDHITRLYSEDDPRLEKLREADVAPDDLEEAFAKVCVYPEVSFPFTDGHPPDPRPAGTALKKLLTSCRRYLPDSIPENTTCPLQHIILKLTRGLKVSDLSNPAKVARLLKPCKSFEKPTYKW